jgi:ribulose-phosphate 3-epimerase
VDLPRSPAGLRPIEIAPSVLPADFSRLGDEVVALEKAGVDRIQWDVMDGRFVPNLTFGPDVIAACRPHVTVPFEAHLMVEEPDALMSRYVDAGCELLLVHAESTRHLHRSLGRVRELGARAAVALNPATPAAAVEDVLDLCDMVLVMTVNPGFGGQDYIATMEPKIRRIRQMILDGGYDCDLEVDGGISPTTVAGAARAGANVLVAGSALYRDPGGLEHAVTELRDLATATRTDDPQEH